MLRFVLRLERADLLTGCCGMIKERKKDEMGKAMGGFIPTGDETKSPPCLYYSYQYYLHLTSAPHNNARMKHLLDSVHERRPASVVALAVGLLFVGLLLSPRPTRGRYS